MLVKQIYMGKNFILNRHKSMISCGGIGQQWTIAGEEALGAVDLGMEEALLEEVAINLTIEMPELTQDWETNS